MRRRPVSRGRRCTAAATALWGAVLVWSAWSAWGQEGGASFGTAFFQHLLWTFPLWALLVLVILWQHWPLDRAMWRTPAGWGLILCTLALLPSLGLLVAFWSLQRRPVAPLQVLPARVGTAVAEVRRGFNWARPVLEIWVVDSGERSGRLLRLDPEGPPIGDLTWSADGRRLGALLGRSELRLWDVADFAEIARLQLDELGLPAAILPFQLRLNADGSRFYLASTRPGSSSVVIWSVAGDGSQPASHLYLEGLRSPRELEWEVEGMRVVVRSPRDGRSVVLGPESLRSLMGWDVRAGASMMAADKDHPGLKLEGEDTIPLDSLPPGGEPVNPPASLEPAYTAETGG